MFKTKYEYDKKAFSKITKKSAYWVGFLLADGYFNKNRLQIKLQHKDKELLKQFRDFIKSPKRPIREFTTNIGNMAVEIRIRSWDFYNDLKVFNLHKPKKDRNVFNISILQKEIMPHFIRGYFDGDGCFYVDKRGYLFAEITGNKDLLRLIKKILLYNNIITEKKKIVKNGSIFRIRLNAKETLKLGEYIYGEYPNIYLLKRKYFIYKSHCERLNVKTNMLHI